MHQDSVHCRRQVQAHPSSGGTGLATTAPINIQTDSTEDLLRVLSTWSREQLVADILTECTKNKPLRTTLNMIVNYDKLRKSNAERTPVSCLVERSSASESSSAQGPSWGSESPSPSSAFSMATDSTGIHSTQRN